MSEQIIPFGGTVEVAPDGSTFVPIPECKGMPVPQTTTEYPEVTSLDSPGGFREFISGLKDGGELSFVAGYTAAGFNLLRGYNSNDTLVTFRVTFPQQPSQSSSGDVFTFTGFVSPSVSAGDVGAPVDMEIAVRISGDYTYTQGS